MGNSSYSLEEVAKHNHKESLWIIIDNNVYDVTKWQNNHPGGKRMLQKVGGTDASKQFHKYHNAETVMRKFGQEFLIGRLSQEVVKTNATSAVDLVHDKLYTNWSQSAASIQKQQANLINLNSTAQSEPDVVEPPKTAGDQIPFADPMWHQGFYSPYYTEKHALVRDRVRSWMDKNIQPFIDEWEAVGEFPNSLYTQFGQAGWLAYCTGSRAFPAKYIENKHSDICSNAEFDAFVGMIVNDEICRAGSGALCWFLTGGFGIGLPPVINYARASVQNRVIPEVISGRKRICLCITEPRGGSDVANLETTAEKSADGEYYLVNGVKKWITNGLWADYFSVAVRTGGPGMNGISMVLIEKSMLGVSVRKIETQGMRGSGSAFIEFDDVKVPTENLIGDENEGFKVIMSNFNHERVGIIIQAIRFSRVCFEDAIKWSLERETFGKKLFAHAVIRNKLAQMANRIEAAQASLDSLVYQDQCMDPFMATLRLGGPIAGLKAFSTQVFEYVAREASQIFGGLAYTKGGKGGRVERLYRDVRALAIPGGSEEIMLDLSIRQSIKVQQKLGANL